MRSEFDLTEAPARRWAAIPADPVPRFAHPWLVRAVAGLPRHLAVVLLVAATELVALVARPILWLRRREPIAGRRRGDTTWRAVHADAVPPRSAWGRTPLDVASAGPRRLTVGRALSLVVVVVFLDLNLGAVLNAVRGGPEREPGREVVLPPTSPEPPPLTLTLTPYDNPVADAPALAGVPWAHEFFRDLSVVTSDEQPYLLFRNRDHQSRYLNTEDGARRSYQPADADDAPVVWFFGGSTMLGWAQRDEHTIASEVARLAEADGHPVRVVNFGVPGYVNFQEVMYFEQRVAALGAPDLVVFYDGSNDLAAALTGAQSDQPKLLNDPLNKGLRMQGELPTDDPVIDLQALSDLVHGRNAWRDSLPSVVGTAMRTYERGIEIARDLADEHGAQVAVFLQPMKDETGGEVIGETRRHVPDGVVDLSHALDGPGQDTYIDVVHTNERGARLVAEAMYDHLQPTIAGLRSRPDRVSSEEQPGG